MPGLPTHRTQLKQHSPRIKEFRVPSFLRSRLVGPQGSTLNKINETTGAVIDVVPDSDRVILFAPNEGALNATEAYITELLGPQVTASLTPYKQSDKFYIGQDLRVKVSHVTEFGAVVDVS